MTADILMRTLADFAERGRAASLAMDELFAGRSNYREMIADKFIMIRGRGMALSATDLALIECWHDRHIPIWIVFAVLDELENRPAHRRSRIRHIAYLEDEIEARFAEWREGRAGAH